MVVEGHLNYAKFCHLQLPSPHTVRSPKTNDLHQPRALFSLLLLSWANLSRGFDATPLFEGVSFELHAGM